MMWFFKLIDHIRSLWWYSSEGQFGLMYDEVPVKPVKEDKDAPICSLEKKLVIQLLRAE